MSIKELLNFDIGRFLLRVPAPRVSRDQAIEIARNYFYEKYSNPVISFEPYVKEQLRTWAVCCTFSLRPQLWVFIDNQTGEVTKEIHPRY